MQPTPAGAAVAFALLLAACGPTADPTQGSDAGTGRPDAREAGDDDGDDGDDDCTQAIDVVFVLDVSSSMNFVLEDLEANLNGVVDAANALAPQAHFGLVSFSDNAAIDLGGDLEGGKVHTSSATLISSLGQILATYTDQNRNPGDGPGGPTTQNPICEENAPDALFLATQFPWRPDSTRVIITATDDTFLEAPDNYGDRDHDGDWSSSDYPREGDYPALHGMVDTTDALTAAKIRIFSFTRLTQPGLFDRCGTGRRLGWAHITDGWTTPYAGHDPFPLATDGANFDLARVQAGTLSMADTINQVVVDSHCNDVE